MPNDILNELESKVDNLITSLQKIRNENQEKNSRIVTLEGENAGLKSELEALKSDSLSRQHQLDTAAEKIRNVIERLETVE